ncbi:ABC transporter ATP-binding protein [Paenibacillus thalictri]|uniref:Quaternary amine transport ATP-binding protein n=1 Tax=Paenibacillus thalictri TaxID=2527873 RepID=A0A4Q9DCZ1_9BACL|nr:betaine/proline/choline family ABC transporter ATP-binding protein [Paenibacillus thalictri]TBL68569.1 ATP-binding cassette domain-containing protein [Paenibacillus thalictri]
MYGDKTIIEGLNLRIPAGKIVVFVGPSGCGKTTTLKMINRLIEPTSGVILLNGQDVLKQDKVEVRRSIGYVIQQIGLFPHMTIAENIALVPRLSNRKAGIDIAKTDRMLRMVGLDPDTYRDRYPSELSGGQQQRIGVARALMSDPPIILMDEPFSALDPITREQLQDELIRLNEDVHKTIVFVTHDMDEALKIADEIVIMQAGKVVQQGSPEQILRHPANPFVREFLGEKRLTPHLSLVVDDVMLKQPVKIDPRKGLAEAIQVMQNRKVTGIIVTDKNDNYLGVVDTTDIYAKYSEESLSIGDVMRKNAVTVLSGSALLEAIPLVQQAPFGFVPVIDAQERLKGLLTRGSLVDVLAKPYLEEVKSE